ncbi:secreted and transmembrane protein 1A-like isoform X1 [Alexandromys fortis]|uniref:secreted and transmembrane protein 1A-like isoform X1 n=1 Tax=Alexandromys fortis TaxID=100897 RepID=UPI0021529011|nr:secreted and transmembrane protein 1A-like isoform X1 [Microtus fortis]XP_049996505.1 secreted and transmembrane protein 1A-like isoform X1 [Microtus fortis]XP_049996506.1 secreted and transmembrane protein 1A-like isoform X1 [Microtus fortis]XP_049996507.1 secreted and transmembrane protein 1A-like isoform X1 [Microtus fortis]
MKTWPSLSAVHTPSMFSLLLLVASLNAQNQSWDLANCTQGVLSVPRGSRAKMSCNISNNFTYVTIWLDNNIIFNKTPQGYFRWKEWELQVQGGQAQLVINHTQDVHTGLYLWYLRGCQGDYKDVTLNVSEPSNKDEPTDKRLSTPPSDALIQPKRAPLEDGPETLAGVLVAVILILGLAGIGALICYRRYRSRSPCGCTSVIDLRRF